MSLRERIREFDQRQASLREAELARERANRTALQPEIDRIKKSIQKEYDRMKKETSQYLNPLLEVINYERLGDKGKIEVTTYGFEDGIREPLSYIESKLTARLGSDSGFTLGLKLCLNREVQIYGVRQDLPLVTVNLNEERGEQALEDAVFHAAIETGACYWTDDGSEKIDTSRD